MPNDSTRPTTPLPANMPRKRLILDFESYYDKEYSLRKMTPVEYILDRRFETIGASVRIDTHEPAAQWGDAWGIARPDVWTKRARWLPADKLEAFFAKVPWHEVALVSHNVSFDGAILAWRYGYTPAMYVDTLGMARATCVYETNRASLDAVSKFLHLPPKGDDVVHAMGLRLADFARVPQQFAKYQAYCERDSDNCAAIFDLLAWRFLESDAIASDFHAGEEFTLMDMVARMTITPQFVLNTAVVTAHLKDVRAKKARLVAGLIEKGIIADGKAGRSDLQSNDKLADLLRRLGIDPPTKLSLKTGKEAYAFAKTDEEFTELLDHPDEVVQAVVAARLGVKSTLEETRSERFLAIGNVSWPFVSDRASLPAALPQRPASIHARLFPARMPFPLRYAGAHTGRMSGDWSLNLQNLGRKSQLRRALETQAGYTVVSADASQIEARVVVWLAKCARLVKAFEDGEDVYSTFASMVYGFAVNKRDHPGERFFGKTGVLGLGFQMSAPKFATTCRIQGRAQGLSLEACTMELPLAIRVVKTYRVELAPEVPALWKMFETEVLPALANRLRRDFGVFYTDVDQSIVLPNGMRLFYRNLRREMVPDLFDPTKKKIQWVYEYGNRIKFTFGGKMTENCLAGDSLVLSESGWIRLDSLTTERVWDGVEWVDHDGLSCQGEQDMLCLDGVWMTPEHEVLTSKGWRHAEACDGLDWATVALPDGIEPCRGNAPRQETLDCAMFLRRTESHGGERVYSREGEILRVPAGRSDFQGQHPARHDQAPRLCCVAVDGGSVQATNPPSLGELWGARDTCLPRMVVLRGVLARHGADVSDGPDSRTCGQQRQLQFDELRLGRLRSAGEQSARVDATLYALGNHVARASRSPEQHKQVNNILQTESRRGRVYDILNAGPRNRFVVAGEKSPMIVHNCVQALAKIITMNAAARIQRLTGNHANRVLAGQIHDQLIYVTPTADAESFRDVVVEEMSRRLDWFATLPLAAEGEIGPNLLEAK